MAFAAVRAYSLRIGSVARFLSHHQAEGFSYARYTKIRIIARKATKTIPIWKSPQNSSVVNFLTLAFCVESKFPFKHCSFRILSYFLGPPPICDVRVLGIILGYFLEFVKGFCYVLGDYVIAKASLLVHHSKVIVIAIAERYVRHDLVFALPALDNPNRSAAGFELVPTNLP